MELQKIKQLIDVLAASDLSELEMVEGDHKVRLVRRGGGLPSGPASAGSAVCIEPPAAPLPASAEVIAAPLYGILHLTPSPGAPVYVKPGDQVRPGQTLCVVEAMKMFHEVKADRSATLAAILATGGQEVDTGQALFRLTAPA